MSDQQNAIISTDGGFSQEQDSNRGAVERQQLIKELAPALWHTIVSRLDSFLREANEQLGEDAFAVRVTSPDESSTPTYLVMYNIKPNRVVGLSWDIQKCEIQMAMAHGCEVFRLDTMAGAVIIKNSLDQIVDEKTLIHQFAKAVLGGTVRKAARAVRFSEAD